VRPFDLAVRYTGQAPHRWLSGLAALAFLAVFAPEAQAVITAGLDHSCAITPPGIVECWGRNSQGQLGDGTFQDSALPVAVTGLEGLSIVSIDAGDSFTCARTDSGAAYCWGRNAEGQLGNGTSAMSPTPVAVVGLGGTVESFSTGSLHVCALLVGGSVECWGDNVTGQLGDGTNVSRPTPGAVSGLGVPVSSVASGFDHTCAVTTGGDAFCWGDNFFGQLGDDGASIETNVPTAVIGVAGNAAGIAAGGFHTCLWTTAGVALCWGDNFYGQVGNHVFVDHLIATVVPSLGGAVQELDAGDSFTCAVLDSGDLKCWGENLDGQLGDGTADFWSSPASVAGLGSEVMEIGLGYFHTCAETALGAGYCWGDNAFGQLGNGSLASAFSPVQFFSGFLPSVPLSFASRVALGVLLALGGAFVSRRRWGR